MSQLDKVIRRVHKKPHLEPNETFISVNPSTGKVSKSWLQKAMGKKLRSYVVYSSGLPRNIAEGESRVVPVKDFETDRELGIIVKYRIQCPKGNVDKVGISLCRDETPEEAFLNILDLAVQEFINGRESQIIDEYNSLKSKFSETVKKFIEKQSGLAAEIRIHLKYEDCLDAFQITERSIPIRVADNTDEHSLMLTLNLVKDEDRLVNAVIAYPNLHEIEKKVIGIIQAFFVKNVTFHAFYEGMKDQELNKQLKETINGGLRSEGRKLGRWSLKTSVKGGKALGFLTLSIAIHRVPYQASENVVINNEIQLILKDAGKLKASGIEDLEKWARERLERIIEEEVFEMRYLDFLLRFGPVEENIRERMKTAADFIGYQVKHLISRPDMKEEKYLKPVPYTFTYKGLPTLEADITVNLEVVATFAISNLNEVEEWLNKNIDLQSVIEASVRSELEQVLHQQSPETVYMRFSINDFEGSPSLETQLSKVVKEHLEKNYNADVIRLPVIKPLDTEIGAFVRGIIDEIQDFTAQIAPLGGTQDFTFQGKFTIVSVDEKGWSRIRKRDFTIDEVKLFYVDTLETILGSLPADDFLAYKTPEHQRDLERVANEKASRAVVERYGVNIAVNNLRRGLSDIENEVRNLKSKSQLYDLEQASHLIDESREDLKSDDSIANLDRKSRLEQAEILHEMQKERLASLDEDESKEQLEIIDQNYIDRIKPIKQKTLAHVDDVLSKFLKDSNSTGRLPPPSPMAELNRQSIEYKDNNNEKENDSEFKTKKQK